MCHLSRSLICSQTSSTRWDLKTPRLGLSVFLQWLLRSMIWRGPRRPMRLGFSRKEVKEIRSKNSQKNIENPICWGRQQGRQGQQWRQPGWDQKKRWKTQAWRFTSCPWDWLWQDCRHQSCWPMLPWTHMRVCDAPQPTYDGGCPTMHPLQQACPKSGILCWGLWPHLYPPLTRQVPRPRPLHSGSSSMQPVLAMGR